MFPSTSANSRSIYRFLILNIYQEHRICHVEKMNRLHYTTNQFIAIHLTAKEIICNYFSHTVFPNIKSTCWYDFCVLLVLEQNFCLWIEHYLSIQGCRQIHCIYYCPSISETSMHKSCHTTSKMQRVPPGCSWKE